LFKSTSKIIISSIFITKLIFIQVPVQKGISLNSILSCKSTAHIVRTSSSTCQLLQCSGHVMGNNSLNLYIIEMGKTLHWVSVVIVTKTWQWNMQ